MTSSHPIGLSADRIRGSPGLNIDHLECSICREILWKPVACQSCETPFCSACINRWLVEKSIKCPHGCPTYAERKCPPFIVKILSQLQIACFFESNGCNEVLLRKHTLIISHFYVYR